MTWDSLESVSVWLHEVDAIALGEFHDRLLPIGRAAEVGASLALVFAADVAGVHGDDLLAEDRFDGALDLGLVRLRVDLEHVRVVLVAEEGGLLGELDGLDDLEDIFHGCVRGY